MDPPTSHARCHHLGRSPEHAVRTWMHTQPTRGSFQPYRKIEKKKKKSNSTNSLLVLYC